ncbi:RING-type domain-containing protein [Caerostris darwini]|uniref:RING-type domain-containing protein n=1 Tax=Caerostris darwini TaxID=1538125 RepID=A0AAV4S045_9ARAC|nr:RING-type domain-containing protein [Caerostris darwini]
MEPIQKSIAIVTFAKVNITLEIRWCAYRVSIQIAVETNSSCWSLRGEESLEWQRLGDQPSYPSVNVTNSHFHEYCIENWLKWVKASCPIDKKSIIRKDYLKEIKIEKTQLVHERLSLKDKYVNVFTKGIPDESVLQKHGIGKTVLSPRPATAGIQSSTLSSPISCLCSCRGKDRLSTPLFKSSPVSIKSIAFNEHGNREGEISSPRRQEFKRYYTPTPTKDFKKTEKHQKFNYRDFLNSLDIIKSDAKDKQRDSHVVEFLSLDGVRVMSPKCTRINDIEVRMDFDTNDAQKVAIRKEASFSNAQQRPKDRKGGWVYKNDINLLLRKKGLYKRPMTS